MEGNHESADYGLYVWHLLCHKSWNCGFISGRNQGHTLCSFCFAVTDPPQKVKVQTDRSHLYWILCHALDSFTLGALGMSGRGCCPPFSCLHIQFLIFKLATNTSCVKGEVDLYPLISAQPKKIKWDSSNLCKSHGDMKHIIGRNSNTQDQVTYANDFHSLSCCSVCARVRVLTAVSRGKTTHSLGRYMRNSRDRGRTSCLMSYHKCVLWGPGEKVLCVHVEQHSHRSFLVNASSAKQHIQGDNPHCQRL